MNQYIVMQGNTYEEDREAGMIWTDQKDRGGKTPHSWKRIEEVQKGDQIFHCVHGEILAISVADENYIKAGDRYFVKLNYFELPKPLVIKEVIHKISEFLPIKYSPFRKSGDGNQGYLFPCNEQLALTLLGLIQNNHIDSVGQEQLQLAIETVIQKEQDVLTPMMAEMEMDLRAKIRQSAENFKRHVAPLWDEQCALCGIELPALLEAAHSKPWHECTLDERMDAYNGLILCKNHATLYTNGYIAFDGTGSILISERIPSIDFGKYDVHVRMKVLRKEENKRYFRWHRKNIFR